jgi:hypothetical protein
MRDLEDEARIKTYMEAKMTHIKMYNECMNLADGLDVEKFAELVRADEREKVAHEAMDRMVAENQRLGLYDDATPEVTPEVTGEVTTEVGVDAAYTKNDTKAGVLHKEWVGLTDEEIAQYWGDTHAGNTRYVQSFARALEARLKEKNGG